MALILSLTVAAMIAHPLGDRNFDRGVQVVIRGDRIRIEYEVGVTDLTIATELLALLERGELPTDTVKAAETYRKLMAPIVGRGLLVVIDGAEAELIPFGSHQSKTDHWRFEFVFEIPFSPTKKSHRVEIIDTNFVGEKGFRRIALKGADEIEVVKSSVPPILVRVPLIPTWEMTPEEEERSHRADATFRAATNLIAADATPALIEKNEPAVAESRGGDNELVHLLPQTIGDGYWLVLVSAFVLGAIHALRPGHGKTLVAAYLVGEQGTVWHAVLLGLVTTITHTGIVIFVALMLQPFAKTRWFDQGQVSFWLMLLSGILVIGVGGALFFRRIAGKEDLLHVHGPGGHSHLPDGTIVWHDVDHDSQGRQHDHLHDRRHDPDHHHHRASDHGESKHTSTALTEGSPRAPRKTGVGVGSLVALGISGGIIPCDEAVLLLVIAIGAGLVQSAIYILLAFSAGLAAVLVALGILVVKIKGFAASKPGAGPWLVRLQYLSSMLILAIGFGLCVAAFRTEAASRLLHQLFG